MAGKKKRKGYEVIKSSDFAKSYYLPPSAVYGVWFHQASKCSGSDLWKSFKKIGHCWVCE